MRSHGSKRVIDRDDYVQKIRAAVDARGNRDFFFVARTDALAAVDLDEAIRRVEAASEAERMLALLKPRPRLTTSKPSAAARQHPTWPI